MSSSIPAATDHLLTLANQVATTIGSGLVVADGWPSTYSEYMFGVGGDAPLTTDGEESVGAASFIGLGAHTVEEKYAIPCWIYRHVGGAKQKTARDAVFAVWAAFIPLLRADLNLGGALNPPGGIGAGVTDFRLVGPASQEEASKGRFSLLTFSITCSNRY